MIDGQWGDRGPELLAVAADGKVRERRDLRGSPPPANPRGRLELVELHGARPTAVAR